MQRPRNISTQVIVRGADDLSLMSLVEGVARHLESKGFKVTLPHCYPEDPLIIEVPEEIPHFTY